MPNYDSESSYNRADIVLNAQLPAAGKGPAVVLLLIVVLQVLLMLKLHMLVLVVMVELILVPVVALHMTVMV